MHEKTLYFAQMPPERRSKSASKKYPLQPWTKATMQKYAENGNLVNCIAIDHSQYAEKNQRDSDFLEATLADEDDLNGQPIYGNIDRKFLRDRCIRVSQDLAKKLHPNLF